jgi:hypothetical protein
MLTASLRPAAAFARASKAPATQAAYGSDFRIFEVWCAARGISALPASAESLCAFLPWPRKSQYRCDHCGSQFGDMRPWDWPPDNPTHIIWLHSRCEAPWYDSNGLPEDVR